MFKAELVVVVTCVSNLDAMADIHHESADVSNTVGSTKLHDSATDVIDNPVVKPSTNDVRASVDKLHTYVGAAGPVG